MSNWKYASLVVAVGTATSSILLQYSNVYTWVPAALSAVAVITGIFSPPPARKGGTTNAGNPSS